MKNIDALNLMAKLDGEAPFSASDMPDQDEVIFDSLSDANLAFTHTSLIRKSLCIQVVETNIPASWTEMINSHPEVAKQNQDQSVGSKLGRFASKMRDDSPIPVLLSRKADPAKSDKGEKNILEHSFLDLPSDQKKQIAQEAKIALKVKAEDDSLWDRILASFGANRGAWGGGFATACLVLILIDPSSESDPTLGTGIAASQKDALLGLRGSSVQAASQKIDTETSSRSEDGGLIFDLKERQGESCKDNDPASDTGKDVAKDVADICDSKSADR